MPTLRAIIPAQPRAQRLPREAPLLADAPAGQLAALDSLQQLTLTDSEHRGRLAGGQHLRRFLAQRRAAKDEPPIAEMRANGLLDQLTLALAGHRHGALQPFGRLCRQANV